jgi:hypothetical protein
MEMTPGYIPFSLIDEQGYHTPLEKLESITDNLAGT